MTTKPRLIAAHHIALLLLSTAKEQSPEHHDIVELNGPGVWKALAELDLVNRDGEHGLWYLSTRGQAYVEAILTLPLPGASTPAPSRKSRLGRVLRAASASGVAHRRKSLREQARPESLDVDTKLQSASADSEDEGEAPPRAPNPKPIPDIIPAAEQGERFKQAEQLLNRGFGLNEVAETLEIDVNEVERRYFFR